MASLAETTQVSASRGTAAESAVTAAAQEKEMGELSQASTSSVHSMDSAHTMASVAEVQSNTSRGAAAEPAAAAAVANAADNMEEKELGQLSQNSASSMSSAASQEATRTSTLVSGEINGAPSSPEQEREKQDAANLISPARRAVTRRAAAVAAAAAARVQQRSSSQEAEQQLEPEMGASVAYGSATLAPLASEEERLAIPLGMAADVPSSSTGNVCGWHQYCKVAVGTLHAGAVPSDIHRCKAVGCGVALHALCCFAGAEEASYCWKHCVKFQEHLKQQQQQQVPNEQSSEEKKVVVQGAASENNSSEAQGQGPFPTSCPVVGCKSTSRNTPWRTDQMDPRLFTHLNVKHKMCIDRKGTEDALVQLMGHAHLKRCYGCMAFIKTTDTHFRRNPECKKYWTENSAQAEDAMAKTVARNRRVREAAVAQGDADGDEQKAQPNSPAAQMALPQMPQQGDSSGEATPAHCLEHKFSLAELHAVRAVGGHPLTQRTIDKRNEKDFVYHAIKVIRELINLPENVTAQHKHLPIMHLLQVVQLVALRRAPSDGGDGKLDAKNNHNVMDFYDDEEWNLGREDMARRNLKTAEAWFKAGSAKRARQALSSKPMMPIDEDVIRLARQKHPLPPLEEKNFDARTEYMDMSEEKRPKPTILTRVEVRRQIKSLDPHAGGGPSGWTGGMLQAVHRRHQAEVESLMLLIGAWMQNGSLLPETEQVLLAGRLIVQNGRPLVLGEIFSKVVSGALLALAPVDALFPMDKSVCRQHAFRKDGCAALTALVRMEAPEQGRVRLSLDAKNAYNSISRKLIFKVLHATPALRYLVPFVLTMYGSPTILIMNKPDGSICTLLASTTGVRQGERLSTLIYSIVQDYVMKRIMPLAGVTSGEAFADDYYPLGNKHTVAFTDPGKFKQLVNSAFNGETTNAWGFALKEKALGALVHGDAKLPANESVRQACDARNVPWSTTDLLVVKSMQTLITDRPSPAVQKFLDAKLAQVKQEAKALLQQRVPAQTAYYLLRTSVAHAFSYLNRAMPPLQMHRINKEMRAFLRQEAQRLSGLTNADVQNPRVRRRITMPLRCGGGGIAPVEETGPISYHAAMTMLNTQLSKVDQKQLSPGEQAAFRQVAQKLQDEYVAQMQYAAEETPVAIGAEPGVEEPDEDGRTIPMWTRFDKQSEITRRRALIKTIDEEEALENDLKEAKEALTEQVRQSRQAALDEDEQLVQSLEAKMPALRQQVVHSVQESALFASLQARQAKLWLLALPYKHGTMSNRQFKVAMRSRYGLTPLPELKTVCSNCTKSDTLQTHSSHCNHCRQPGAWKLVNRRHDRLVVAAQNMLERDAHMSAKTEQDLRAKRARVPGSRPDAQRADVIAWAGGKEYLIDVVCTTASAPWRAGTGAIGARASMTAAADEAERAKLRKYRNENANEMNEQALRQFVPAAFQHTGGWGKRLVKFIRAAAKHGADVTGEDWKALQTDMARQLAVLHMQCTADTAYDVALILHRRALAG
jgi:hypothetical protein